jgi:hypothetical protein
MVGIPLRRHNLRKWRLPGGRSGRLGTYPAQQYGRRKCRALHDPNRVGLLEARFHVIHPWVTREGARKVSLEPNVDGSGVVARLVSWPTFAPQVGCLDSADLLNQGLGTVLR